MSPSPKGVPWGVNAPGVTIITPTYNRVGFLPETIDSILSQGYPDLELLVLDDGSTDDTETLLNSYAARFPDRFRWVRHENMGQPATINRGIAIARGDLLCVVNSDDLLLPGAVARLAEEFVRDPSLVGVYPDFRHIDEQGSPIVDFVLPELSIVEFIRLQADAWTAGMMFTKGMAMELGGWDTSYRMMPDLDFRIRAGLFGPFRHVPEILVSWRRHSGAITVATRGAESIRERFRLFESLFARGDLPEEVQAVQLESFRNLHYIAGSRLLDDINRPEDRFIIHDRLYWQIDSRVPRGSIEAELLAKRERVLELEALVSGQQAQLVAESARVETVEKEIASRDRALRLERRQLEELRNVIISNETERARSNRPWWFKVIRVVTPGLLRRRIAAWREGRLGPC